MRLAALAAMLILAIVVVAGVSAAADIVTLNLAPGGAGVRTVWLPCNGTLTPFYEMVYAIPPGYDVRIVSLQVDYSVAPLHGYASRTPAYVEPLLPNATPVTATCRAVVVQKGVWRGVTLLTIMAASYTSRGSVLKDVKLRLEIDRVGPARSIDQWTYSVVENAATLLYPRGWSVERGPYRIGIIVLTRDALLPAVGEWATIKEMEGYIVKVLTVDRICREYKSIVESLGLRAAIRYAVEKVYRSAPDVYRYLVIIGDDSGRLWNVRITSCSMLQPWEVPTAYFYNPASSYDLIYSHSGYFVPSDIYYVTFDGNWDANGNGILGEYPQDVKAYDPYPELLPVRIPVRDVRTARLLLEKLAFNTPTGDYMVLAGSILYYLGEVNKTLEAQGDTFLEALYQYGLSRDTWLKPIRLYEHYPPTTSITSPSMINGNLTFTNLMMTLQNVRGVTTIVAHGTADCVWRKIWVNDTNGNGVPDKDEIRYEPLFCAANVYGLQPQLLYTIAACLTGYYDRPDGISLGEALVHHGSGYLGWSRVTFAPLLPPDEESNPEYWCCTMRLVYDFYTQLLQPSSIERLGDALLKAIVEYVSAEPLDQPGFMGNVSRRVFFALTAMFDPTRRAYSYPTSFDVSHLVIPVRPGIPVKVRLRLYAIETGLPVARQPVNVYVYHGGYNVSSSPLLTAYTNDKGVVTFTVTSGVEGLNLLLYYPGSDAPPAPYEPITAIVTLNTSLAPWLIVTPSSASTLEWIRIRGCGFPAYAPLDVLIEGVRLTRIYSNGTGCFDMLITLPYTLPLGPANITVVDARYPAISASARIIIADNLAVRQTEALQRLSAALATILDVLRSISVKIELLQNELRAVNATATSKASEITGELASMKRSLAVMVKEAAGIERKLQDIENLVHLLHGVNRDVKVVLEKTRETLGRVEERLTRLAGMVNAATVRLSELHAIHAYLARLRQDIMIVNKTLTAVLSTVEARITNIAEKVSSLASNYQSTMSTITAILSKLDNLNEALLGLNASLEHRVESLSLALRKLNKHLDLLEEREKAVNVRIATLESSITRITSAITGTQKRLNMLSSSLDMLENRLTAIGLVVAAAVVIAAGIVAVRRA